MLNKAHYVGVVGNMTVQRSRFEPGTSRFPVQHSTAAPHGPVFYETYEFTIKCAVSKRHNRSDIYTIKSIPYGYPELTGSHFTGNTVGSWTFGSPYIWSNVKSLFFAAATLRGTC